MDIVMLGLDLVPSEPSPAFCTYVNGRSCERRPAESATLRGHRAVIRVVFAPVGWNRTRDAITAHLDVNPAEIQRSAGVGTPYTYRAARLSGP